MYMCDVAMTITEKLGMIGHREDDPVADGPGHTSQTPHYEHAKKH